jgi:plastocyanin
MNDRQRWHEPWLRLATVATLLAALPTALGAQSLLERPPNLSAGWVGAPHSVHFNFLHRFNQSGPPTRQVINRPTFLLAYASRAGLLLGAQYATRSDIVERMPNEWEAFARYAVLREARGQPLDLGAQLAYNIGAESVDGELSVARRLGPLRLVGAGRVLSSAYGVGETRFALAGGAAVRLGTWVALAADAGTLLDADDAERPAWGVALQFGVPLTPHTFSLQATNTNSATLQGASRGAREVRWGFEFTVPVALARYFGRRTPPPAPVANADDAAALRVAIADSVRAELETEYQRRWRADSLRFALREDSVRLAEQLAALAEEARQDSLHRADAAAAAERARLEAERERAARQPVRAAIRNLAYEPARIVVDAGTTIVWRNEDPVEHTVTATNRSWDSGTIRPGGTWQRTFDTPGRYEFFCVPHPFMTGVVIVRERS